MRQAIIGGLGKMDRSIGVPCDPRSDMFNIMTSSLVISTSAHTLLPRSVSRCPDAYPVSGPSTARRI